MKTDKTDNELIAEFMGFKYLGEGYHDSSDHCFVEGYQDGNDVYECRWNESWDALMPVVEKILDTAPTDVREINNEGLAIFELSLGTPISEVYKAVVEFIKWYNSKDL